MTKHFKEKEPELETKISGEIDGDLGTAAPADAVEASEVVEVVEATSAAQGPSSSEQVNAAELLKKLEEQTLSEKLEQQASRENASVSAIDRDDISSESTINDDFVSLEQILVDNSGPLPVERAIKLMLSLCNYLEMRVVSHGEITPKIVLYAGDEAFIDDLRGGWLDSLNAYKAPEAVKGAADHRVDVYSLGVMFYEMLTNKKSCPVQNEKSKYMFGPGQLTQSPNWKELPPAIQKIILKCLKKSPSSRYKSAAEVKKALLRYGASKPAPVAGFLTVKNMISSLAMIAICSYVICANHRPEPPPMTSTFATPSAPLSISIAEPADRIVEHNDAPLSEKELGILAKFNIVILLDRSGSMSSTDCASTNSSSQIAVGSTRWDWTANELGNLSRQASKILPNGFDVITWNDRPELFRNCNAEQIEKIYKEHPPSGNNNLGDALVKAFHLKFASSKPLLTAIVTDADPDDLLPSEKAIVDRLGHEQVGLTKVVFLRVGGNDARGEQMLKDLETFFKERLPGNPAVSTVNFPQVSKQGLGRSLVNVVESDGKSKK